MKKIIALRAVVFATAFAAPAFAATGTAHSGKMHHHMEEKIDEMFKKMDTNGDGKVSKAEFDAHKDAMFADADTNKDGMLSEEELRAHKKKKWEAHKAMHGGMHEDGADANTGTTGGSENGTTGSSMSGKGTAGESGTGSPKQ